MSFEKFWRKSALNKWFAIILFIWIVLAIKFAASDLMISQFLFNPDNNFAQWVDFFGEIPGALFIIFSLFVLNTNIKIKNRNYKKLFFIFETLLSAFLFTYILKLFFDYFNINFNFFSMEGVSVFLGFVLVSLLGFYLFKMKFKKFSNKKYLFSKLSILTFVISGILVYFLKFFWGRVRYVDFLSGAGEYSFWYLPQGFLAGSSFVSGHAFMAWSLIPLFLIFSERKKILRFISILLTSLFALFISYERIVFGAHYASDVLFSGGIVLITFLILYMKNFSEENTLPTAKTKKRKKGKQ